MSNLGAYQWITSTSKKVGGPINLLLLTGATGAITGTIAYKLSEVGIKKFINSRQSKKSKQLISNGQVYSVTSLGTSNEGLNFPIGSQYKVLEVDGDSVLIEKIDDDNNPYFVSKEFLCTISDFKE